MKVFYDIPYFKEIMMYVLVPVIVVLIIVGASLLIYSKKNKDHESEHYNFVMNFWSCLVGIIVTGAILAIALGFSVAMTEKMVEYNLIKDKEMLYLVLKYFPIIPGLFVLWYVFKFIKTIYFKPKNEKKLKKETAVKEVEEEINTETKEDIEKNVTVDNGVLSDNEVKPIEVNEMISSSNEILEDTSVEPKEEDIITVPIVEDKESILPPLEETLKEEMVTFTYNDLVDEKIELMPKEDNPVVLDEKEADSIEVLTLEEEDNEK